MSTRLKVFFKTEKPWKTFGLSPVFHVESELAGLEKILDIPFRVAFERTDTREGKGRAVFSVKFDREDLELVLLLIVERFKQVKNCTIGFVDMADEPAVNTPALECIREAIAQIKSEHPEFGAEFEYWVELNRVAVRGRIGCGPVEISVFLTRCANQATLSMLLPARSMNAKTLTTVF